MTPSGHRNGEIPSGERIPNHYIVVFKDSVAHPANLAEAQTEARGRDLGLVYRHALKGYSAELSSNAVESLRENSQVDYVVPDRRVEALAQTIPTGISRTKDTENETAAIDGIDTRVNADVAVIDTGIDTESPDLNLFKRLDCVPPTESSPVECIEGAGGDPYGHGTHVAGTIGAIDNGSGVVGVAPGVRLWSLRALNSKGEGAESWIIAAIDWVTAHSSEIEVVNMSLGGFYGGGADPEGEAIKKSVKAGVVYVVAAGNSAAPVEFFNPARVPVAITVSALADYDGKAGGESETTCRHDVGPDDTMASFSNYGEGVDIAAPGVCIYSTLPTTGSELGKEYGFLSGTSMAAPHVAGAAALLASKSNPNSEADVIAIRNQLVNGGALDFHHNAPEAPSPLLYLGKTPRGPEAITGSASPVALSAKLTGGIEPRGLETEYKFEYGKTTSYGSIAPVPSGKIGTGAGYTRVSQAISGLQPDTEYHFRMVGTNKEGTFVGKDEAFTTIPVNFTIVATEIGETKATLNGVQTLYELPEGESAEYAFEYGHTTKYGQKVAASEFRTFGNCGSCGEEEEVFGELFGHALKPLTGLEKESKYHYRMVTSVGSDTFKARDQAFRTVTWPQWTVSGGFKGNLNDVSCPEANVCMGISNTETESWNGTTGKVSSTPKEDTGSLFDVDCTSSTSCMGVGTRIGGKPYIARWNSEKWTSLSVPALPSAAENAYLEAVSCPSANWCMAVGIYVRDDGGKFHPEYISMIWDGTSWTFQPLPEAPLPGPFEYGAELKDVSCTSSTNCVAVGFETMHWDGSSWSAMAMPSPKVVLRGVSCSNPSSCMAVGSSGGEEGAARRWNGSEWLVVPMGILTRPGRSAYVDNISCAAAWSCVAVGRSDAGPWWPMEGFVTRWDGKDWAVEALGSSTPVSGVDCDSTAHCTVVGQSGMIETSSYTVPAPPKPSATTEAATGVSQSEATLNAAVETNNEPTSYYFEYGTTTGYGSKAPVSAKEITGAEKPVAVAQTISGLTANTTYHYRVVVQGEAGTGQGKDMTLTTLSSCKGAGGKCEWKTQSTPDLSKSEYSLSGVSCAGASMCMGVGTDQLAVRGEAELWDGTTWTNKLALGSSLAGVSCTSTTWCMAVGASKGSPGAFRLKEEGSSWNVEGYSPPTPSGGSKTTLRSVSCTSTTACTAVGSYYVESESKYKPLVERWNGTSWSVQSAPNPPTGSAEKAMLSVSCSTSTSCFAVGTANNAPFAESWNGTSWSVSTTVVPSPSVQSTLEGVSCTSATACTAVGSNKKTSSGEGSSLQPLAERWNGTSWSIQTTPIPSEAKGDVKLVGVSCASASACTAVGRWNFVAGENPPEQKTLAEAWNGTSWSLQTSTNFTLKINGLSAVSCSASNACTAVGLAQPETGAENQFSIAERWNGSEWKSQTTPEQSRSGYSLAKASCPSASLCWAVGTDSYAKAGVAELWNAGTWIKKFALGASGVDVACPTANWCMMIGVTSEGTPGSWRLEGEGFAWGAESKTVPVPSGGSVAVLRSVSCTSTTACTAVGSYYVESEKTYKPLVERWNGTSWSVQSAPNPPTGSAQNAMLSVSCSSSTSCVAVGTANSAPSAERWTGTKWLTMTTPNPGTLESTLEGVSCNSESACMAIGSYRETGKGQYRKPLAERWNGTEWSAISVPGPSEAKGDVTMKGISCSAAVYCTAVGQYSPEAAGLELRTLAEYWDGAKWTVQASPNSALKANALTGVSCVSAILCTAVGSAQTEAGVTLGGVSLAQRYE